MICVTWLLLIAAIYSGGVVCSVGLACEKYLSVKFEYVSFPTGLCSTYICAFFSYYKCIWCSQAL